MPKKIKVKKIKSQTPEEIANEIMHYVYIKVCGRTVGEANAVLKYLRPQMEGFLKRQEDDGIDYCR